MNFFFLLPLLLLVSIQPAHGVAVERLASPGRFIDSEQLCSGKAGRIDIPPEWARLVRHVSFRCRPETRGEDREPAVFLRYDLRNASFHGYRLVELRVSLLGDAGAREYVLDRPFAVLKAWFRQHLGQVLGGMRESVPEGLQVEDLPGGLSLRADEITRIRVLADPENRARTIVSVQWAD